MQNNKNHISAYWFDYLIMLFAFFATVCRISDPVFLLGILFASFLVWKWKKTPLSFSGIDKWLILIFLYQVISLFFSVEPTSGFFAIKTLAFSIIFYFFLRTRMDSLPKIEHFLFIISVIMALFCVVALITFGIFQSTCAYVDFANIYDFRYLYKPLGYLSNVWGSLLIAFTGIILLSLHLSKEMIDRIVHSGEIEKSMVKKKNITDNSYSAKFQVWYHSSTFIHQMIP